MSGLAQAFASIGWEVAGSDREISENGVNSALISQLKKGKIQIFPQNGSFIKYFIPDILVYSTAIEQDNPDLNVAEGIRKIHRSEALNIFSQNLFGKISIAVTGTSGKTTVSAWIAETLLRLKLSPTAIIGGNVVKFADNKSPGNFLSGNGKYFVFEADESDKSLINYFCDYAVILNTGPDHYSIDEQNEIFAKFASSAKKAVICNYSLKSKIASSLSVSVYTFGKNTVKRDSHIQMLQYISPSFSDDGKAHALVKIRQNTLNITLPITGEHNAINASAVLSLLQALGINNNAITALEEFTGVRRRFNIVGKNKNGSLIVDDYAHNPDKIESCILTAKELCKGRLFFIFQPHGYRPLALMQDELKKRIKKVLSKNDIFIFLPVFYAGGTTSFNPKSQDVTAIFAKEGINCRFYERRIFAERFLINNSKEDDLIVVAGARDNTLSQWAIKLVQT